MTATDPASPGRRILRLWRLLGGLPGGRWLFHRLLYWTVPYSGSTGATIDELEPGRVRLHLDERRRVRNHLGSVHAVALVNVGELASGLAMLTALPPELRGIVVRLETDFLKKARGLLVVESSVDPPDAVHDDVERTVESEIRDADGDVVARVRVDWRLSPR